MPDKKSVYLALLKVLEDIRKVKGSDAKIRALRFDNSIEYLIEDIKELIKKCRKGSLKVFKLE